MCGRIVYVWDPITEQLVEKMVDDWDQDPEIVRVLQKARFNVPPASHLPVISQPGPVATVEVARWGFPIPQRPNGVFNTRIEASDSPMWSRLMGESHCLFPVKGFYEWRQGKRKTPFYIHRTDGDTLLLAGIVGWHEWQGETLRCASILTCPPNDLMAGIHERMPVVIEASAAESWLAGDRHLAVPAGDVLSMHEVGPAVGDTKNDGPELMAPINQTGLGAF